MLISLVVCFNLSPNSNLMNSNSIQELELIKELGVAEILYCTLHSWNKKQFVVCALVAFKNLANSFVQCDQICRKFQESGKEKNNLHLTS